MSKAFIELFTIGVSLSFGPCLSFCSPIILPYIVAAGRSWKKGLIAVLFFSFTQLIVYSILGLLLGLVGEVITQIIKEYEILIFIIGGSLISLFGLIIIFGKEIHFSYCNFLNKYTTDNIVKGAIFLGLIVALLPCIPLLGVFIFILLKAEHIWQGAFLGFAFGLGKFFSPIIPLGIFAGSLSNIFAKNKKIHIIFTKTCGLILFYIGMNFIISYLFI